MDSLRKILLGVVHGFWDSVKGVVLVFYIDVEIYKQKAEKEAERKARLEHQQRRLRRNESPTLSSVSSVTHEYDEALECNKSLPHNVNPDERYVESLHWTTKPSKPRISVPFKEKRIANQVLKCCALNGGLTWLSILLFEQLILPSFRLLLLFFYGGQDTEDMVFVWGWLHYILTVVFRLVWVLPIFLLCKVVNSLWFADIANEAFKARKGTPHLIPGISRLVADFFFSLVIQLLFLAQSMVVGLVPFAYIGDILCFLHLSLLYSLYSFEYKWFNMGWELHRRLTYIELNWPYFFGFGIPLTVLTNLTNSLIVSSCIFSIFFPLFILSGNEAKPVVGTIEKPLPLFAPVIFVTNLFFNGHRGETHRSRSVMTVKKTAQMSIIANTRTKTPHITPNTQHQHIPLPKATKKFVSSEESKNKCTTNDGIHRYPQPPKVIKPSLSRAGKLDYVNISSSRLNEDPSSSAYSQKFHNQ